MTEIDAIFRQLNRDVNTEPRVSRSLGQVAFNEGRGPFNFFVRWRNPFRFYAAVRLGGRWLRLNLMLGAERIPPLPGVDPRRN